MARVLTIVLLVALVFLLGCKGGGTQLPAQNPDSGKTGTQNPPTDQPADNSTLEIVFLSATPQVGPTPLKVDFLAVVRGGTPPYNFFWDFTNDGAPDTITNNATVGTASASFTYPFLLEDLAKGLTQSTFTARMWVTDSRYDAQAQKVNPATRISDPVTVVVTSGSSFKFNATRTGITNAVLGTESIEWKFDTTRADEPLKVLDFYTFKSGEDIRFLAEAAEGNPPYKYRWNFDFAVLKPGLTGMLYPANIDYSVDSTLTSPHFAYSYNNITEMTEEANYRLISLQAIDNLGNTVQQFIGVKVVPSEFVPPPPVETFRVIVVTSPPVTLDDDPAAFSAGDVPILVQVDRNNIDNSGMMIVPPVNFSATVSMLAGESGTPPYTYAWDFEGDGYIDTQVLSPTVPYWNSSMNALINPYNWPGDYVCKLRVRDSAGSQVFANIPVRSVDITGQQSVNMLTVKPFAQEKVDEFTSNRGEYFSSGANISFSVDIAGGTAPYSLFWDRDFDGVFTTRPAPGLPGSNDPPGTYESDFAVEITAEMAVPDRIALATYDAGQLVAGYYNAAVRVLDSSIPPVQISAYAPVSITELPAANSQVNDALQPRASHGVAAIGGDIFVIGGFTGNVALQSVDRVRWGDSSYAVDSSRVPGTPITNMPTPRGGLSVGSIQQHIIAVGGVTNQFGTTGAVETMLLSTDGIWKWISRPAMGYRSGSSPQLSYIGMSPGVMRINFGGALGVQDADGFLVTGGKFDGGSVSGTTWFYLPHEGWPDYNPANLSPSTYDYWLTLSDIPTPRYDFATTTLGSWVYTLGGVTADGQISNAVEAINLQTAVWVTMPAMTVPSTGNAAIRVAAPRAGALAISHETEQFIGIFGGYNGVSSSGDYILEDNSLVFSPLSNMWTKTYPLDQPRAHLAGTIIDFTMFAINGENATQAELGKFFELRIAPNT